jgi:hypothetical protein
VGYPRGQFPELIGISIAQPPSHPLSFRSESEASIRVFPIPAHTWPYHGHKSQISIAISRADCQDGPIISPFRCPAALHWILRLPVSSHAALHPPP